MIFIYICHKNMLSKIIQYYNLYIIMWLLDLVTGPGYLTQYINLSKQFHKVMNLAHFKLLTQYPIYNLYF